MPTFIEDEGNGIVTKTTVRNRQVVEERVQDVQPILDHNGRLLTADDGYSPDRTLRRVGSIPMIVVEQWLKEGIDVFNPDHTAKVMQRLNSSDWLKFRTAEGKL